MLEKDWLSRKEAAEYLTRHGYRISPGHLANLAMREGAGPPAYRYGWKVVSYKRTELDQWLDKVRTEIG